MRIMYIGFLVLILFFAVGSTQTSIFQEEQADGKIEEFFAISPTLAVDYSIQHPLMIDSDLALASEAWKGDGSRENPYVIENFSITASTDFYCVSIENTRAFFVVRNCLFMSPSGYDGIRLFNVSNALIESNIADNVDDAIYASLCTNITVSNNIVKSTCRSNLRFYSTEDSNIESNTFQGLHSTSLDSCVNISITGNHFGESSYGFGIDSSTEISIAENEFLHAAFYATGSISSHYNITSFQNTINGKPYGYFFDVHDTDITGNYGSVLVTFSSNVNIHSMEFDGVLRGVMCTYSTNCRITSISIANSEQGILLENSDYTHIDDCTLEAPVEGIRLYHADYTNITNCNITAESIPILSYSSDSSIIAHNYLSSIYSPGVSISSSALCTVSDNDIMVGLSDSTVPSAAIVFSFVSDSHIINNRLIGGEISIDGTISEWDHSIAGNTVDGLPIAFYFSLSNSTITSTSHGQVLIVNCTNMVFSDLTLKDTSSGLRLAHSFNCTITGFHLNHAKSGMTIYYSDETQVLDGVVEGSYMGIYIYYSDYSIMHDVTILNCERGADIYHSDNSVISHSDILDCSVESVRIYSSSNTSFSQNSVNGNTENQLMYISYSPGSIIQHNNFSNSEEYGIYARGDNLTIIENFIWDIDCGIYARYGANMIIANNTLINRYRGCHIYGYVNCNISENTILGGNSDGVLIQESSFFRILDNKIRLNSEGLDLSNCDNITVIGNDLTLNRMRSISLYGSENNVLYNNSFSKGLSGTAYDSGANNTWDNGIDSGNHWSDYNGSIVYTIEGNANSTDRYPSLLLDDEPPMILGPDDMKFEYAAASYGPQISWRAADYSPDWMWITENGTIKTSMKWSGDWIYYDLRYTKPGHYVYTLYVNDTFGRLTSDSVFVEVWTNPDSVVITSGQDLVDQQWPGTGTESDPYRISNLIISVNTTCILIEDVSSYIIIENCTLMSPGEVLGDGISIDNSPNVEVRECTISQKEVGIISRYSSISVLNSMIFGNWHGIILSDSSNSYLEGNVVLGNGYTQSYFLSGYGGITISYSSSTVVRSNIIQDNYPVGVYINSYNVKVLSNTLINNGFFFNFDSDDTPSPGLFEQNTINGKTFGYFKGESNLDISGEEYGQLYLIDCHNLGIQGGVFTASLGVVLSECTEITLEGASILHNSLYGMAVVNSEDIQILQTKFIGNGIVGLYASECTDLVIQDNFIAENGYDSDYYLYGGLILYRDTNCVVSGNIMFNNSDIGIYAYRVYDSLLTDNIICKNNYIGIYVQSSPDDGNGTILYGNKIGWNNINAQDSSNVTQWDNGVDTGNYWSDYSGEGVYIVPASFESPSIDSYPNALSDQDIPIVEDLAPQYLEMGNVTLSWSCTDSNPIAYKLRIDGVFYDMGAWTEPDLAVIIDRLEPGVYHAEVTIYDMPGNSATSTVLITITDETAPYWNPLPQDQILDYDTPLSYQVSASDNHRVDHYSIDDFNHFSVDNSGLITNSTFLDNGTYTIWITAYDPSGNFVNATFTVTVLEEVITSQTTPTDDTIIPTEPGDILFIFVIAIIGTGGVIAVIILIIIFRRKSFSVYEYG